ncbi:MAG: hypothetical protein J7497_11260 [Chitinophagaceae bacterium]|nr:hypothetical protein [Chitinophagaceae bacterium]
MKKNTVYQTILILVAALVFIFILTGYKPLLWLGLVLSLIGVLSPWLAAKVHAGWMWLSRILGYISGNVLLTLVFIVFVIPVSIFIRKKLSIRETGFRIRNHIYQKKDLENPW